MNPRRQFRRPRRLLHPLSVCGVLAATMPVFAQQPVRTTRCDVTLDVEDGVATTTLRQKVHNGGTAVAEADWLLPLPTDAAADKFVMTVAGKELASEVLDATRARAVYEAIVRQRRDPALLEHVGRGCLRARVFPIPPQQSVDVEVRYRAVLPADGGLLRWELPVRGAGIVGASPEVVTLRARIASRTPIRSVFSPTPGLGGKVVSEHEARVEFAAENGVPDRLQLFYGLSEQDFGLHLLPHRRAGEDGWFTMLIAPKRERSAAEAVPKAMTFVVDTSGSMAGAKMVAAQEAMRFFVRSLRPRDRFQVVSFATEAEPMFAKGPVAPDEANVAAALRRIDELQARGGTNIAAALAAALRVPEGDDRLGIVLLLTDGRPTVGDTQCERILQLAREQNGGAAAAARRARVFVLGVGADVDTHLLDGLAAENGGARDYVREGEDLEVKTGSLLTKLSAPVLGDLSLTAEGVELLQMVPHRLPDLFQGERLIVTGRYRGHGLHQVRLTGRTRDERREYAFAVEFPEVAERHDFVPPLCAQRRVAMLLDAMRLSGESAELRDEVARLGREFHIVTPYTSHLILEDGLQLGSATLPSPPPLPQPGRGSPGGGTYIGPGLVAPMGPTTPGPGGVATSGPREPSTAAVPAPTLAEIARRLQQAGMLPADASADEAVAMARQVASELRQAQQNAGRLRHESSGAAAVEDSMLLQRAMRSDSDGVYMGPSRPGGGGSDLLRRLSCRVGGKVFWLRNGVWTDADYDLAKMVSRVRRVVAFGDEYFALLRARPELRVWFAFSAKLIVVAGDDVFEVVPEDRRAADAPPAERTGAAPADR